MATDNINLDDKGNYNPDSKDDNNNIIVDINKDNQDNKDNPDDTTKDNQDSQDTKDDKDNKDDRSDDSAIDFDNTPTPLIITKLTGFEIKDESGKPIEYEDSYQGLAKREEDLVKMVSTEVAGTAISRFFEDNPDLKQAYHYKITKGSLEGFSLGKDYSKVELKDDDTQAQFDIVVEAEMMKGNTKERAEKIANYIKEDGALLEESKLALKFITDTKNEVIRKRDEDLKNQQIAEQKAIDEYWTNVQNIIESGKIKDYSIPSIIKISANGKTVEVTRQDFYNFMAKPIGTIEGKPVSAYDVALIKSNEQRTIEDDIFDAFLVFIGNDRSQLIKGEIKKEQIKNLKDKLKNNIMRKDDNVDKTIHSADNIK